jgi:hypothetical protein
MAILFISDDLSAGDEAIPSARQRQINVVERPEYAADAIKVANFLKVGNFNVNA